MGAVKFTVFLCVASNSSQVFTLDARETAPAAANATMYDNEPDIDSLSARCTHLVLLNYTYEYTTGG